MYLDSVNSFFSFSIDNRVVASEADWPDSYKVNRYVQNFKSNDSKDARGALSDFKRFPTWMWRNHQVADFVEWLREHNDELETKGKAERSENGWNRYNKVSYIVQFVFLF